MIETEAVGSIGGRTVQRHLLRNERGMCASLIDFGATLMALEVPVGGRVRPLVLSCERVEDYPAAPFLGTTVGRFGNRIGEARFTLEGRTFELDVSEGRHHLHGGRDGLGRRFWNADIDEAGNAVTFSIHSPDGDMGYPGNLDAACRYTLGDDDVLRVEMTATADAPTPVNLVHHSYWNLDGQGVIDRHRLQVDGGFYLPTGEGSIPTGEILTVAGTHLDLRRLRQLDAAGEPVIDQAFVLDGRSGMRPAARLESADGAVAMDLSTDQPAVQVYTGFKLGQPGASGEQFRSRAGICLETETFPNAPNVDHFPDCILRPGQTYRHIMEHRFSFD